MVFKLCFVIIALLPGNTYTFADLYHLNDIITLDVTFQFHSFALHNINDYYLKMQLEHLAVIFIPEIKFNIFRV